MNDWKMSDSEVWFVFGQGNRDPLPLEVTAIRAVKWESIRAIEKAVKLGIVVPYVYE